MGKADRNRNQDARARIAALQAAERQAAQRRRLLTVGGAIALVIVIVVGFIVIKGLTKPAKQSGGGALPAAVLHDVANVPVSTLTQVGTGGLQASTLPLKAINDPPLTSGGKPDMLYIGAEFCPYCAAMRWSMAVALSRFGSFAPLKGIHSSSTDTDPNTATLTFYKAHYTSSYLTFSPVENETVNETPLQNPTKAQQALWAKYGSSPQGGLVFPYIYFGGKVVITGPLYDPAVLKGLSWAQIASQLKDPSSPVSQNVNGAANYVTASICKMTNDTPASVCKTGPIPAIESKI
jgi:Domain of unknown function (DUF929)